MDNKDKIVYSVKDLQHVMGIGHNLAYKLAKDRNFPKVIINGRYFFPKEKVLQWMDRNNNKYVSV